MPPRISGFEILNGEMILRFWDQGGQVYVWEGTTAIGPGVWETLVRLEPVAVSGEHTARRLWPALRAVTARGAGTTNLHQRNRLPATETCAPPHEP
jgi:hypothetical protein